LREYGLDFISDTDLFNHVRETVEKYRFNANLSSFNKNLVDPIKLSFDAKVYGKTIQTIVENEIIRQADKLNTNHIGYFHQNIFNFISDRWHVPQSGYDIVNTEEHYYVEMKNKHNTMNSSSAQKTYIRMQNTILADADATCLLVEVIARNSQNSTWNISLDGHAIANRNIRRVSIDKFYQLVTGDEFSFKKLCEALPKVIDDVVDEIERDVADNTVLAELERISPNILKSLYLLAFEQYAGFGDFDV